MGSMNELQQKTITSLEAAEMVDKQHSDLLKDIRRYAAQLNEGNIPSVEFFTESTYPDAKGEDRPCYLVTKKGCEFIANKLTGVKGAMFTAKYINRFHEMEQSMENNLALLPTKLQILQGMLNQLITQEQRLASVEAQSQKAIETVQNIKETFVEEYDNWRDGIKHKISAIQKGMNDTYQNTYNRLYDNLETRAACDLSARVRNGRRRLEEAGASKTKVEAYCRMDVIEEDTRLKEIFTAIVKEYSVKYARDAE
jgi:Rha family phage regulatory protein